MRQYMTYMMQSDVAWAIVILRSKITIAPAQTISVVPLKANISDVRKLLGCVRAIDLTLLL